jgi:glycosyltransferase involved in cell wall biosynthesis
VPVARELTERLAARGHAVDVVTSALVDLHRRPARRSRTETVDGVHIHYLATPFSYRWMGITPTLPVALERLRRPDVVHVFGFRDPVTTGVATWARLRRIPYVFEPLGMFRPRLRKIALKRVLDATLYRGVAGGAAAVVVSSVRERDDVVARGVRPGRVRVRGNGFPEPATADGAGQRAALGISKEEPLVLYAGRIAAGKGIEFLLDAIAALPAAHLVLAGPDDRHGAAERVRSAREEPGLRGRVHVLGETAEPPYALYRAADVLCLPSAGESFGMAAAEAAASGTPVVVTDRCGVAEFFRPGEALVVPYNATAVADALRRVLEEPGLAETLAAGGLAAAERTSWQRVTDRQEQIYRKLTASRTASTKRSTPGP